MKLKERNYAGDHLVVGSLNVLGDIKGGNIAEIRRNIDLIQKQTEFMGRKQNEYWEELSSDGVITPLEKQQLLKEMRSITQSQAAIVLQARSVGMEGSQAVQDYLAVYNDLYSYLYTTLKIFDDMEMNTDIPDRAAFNSYFTSYYYDESFVYIALSKGLLNSLSITVLSSLTDPGTEGEMGLYRGNLYQYVDGAWKHVATGDYKGALTSLPAAIEDSFFLAADDFILTVPFYVNDEPFYVNSYEFGINRLFRKGYIYYCKNGGWREEPDKTNYRYVAAFADVLNITGELPQIFQDALDDLQEQIDDIGVPSYRGASNVDPLNPTEGDFYVYSGTTTAVRRKSDIYKYTNGDWERLDPLESQNSTYYMQALEDILALNNADNGYFAAIFANILISNKAFMDALTTRIITLQQGQPGQPGGYIQSDNYDPDSPESDGFRVDYNGDADFNGDTHIAGKVAIGVPLRNNSDFNDYDVVIGGNTKIAGELSGATGTFAGELSGATGTFEGDVSGHSAKFDSFAFHYLQSGNVVNYAMSNFVSGQQSRPNIVYNEKRRIRFFVEDSYFKLMFRYKGTRVGWDYTPTTCVFTLNLYFKKGSMPTENDYDDKWTISKSFSASTEYVAFDFEDTHNILINSVDDYYYLLIKGTFTDCAGVNNVTYNYLNFGNSKSLPLLQYMISNERVN